MTQRKRVKKPRAFTIHGCEIFSVRESMMGGEFIPKLKLFLKNSAHRKGWGSAKWLGFWIGLGLFNFQGKGCSADSPAVEIAREAVK